MESFVELMKGPFGWTFFGTVIFTLLCIFIYLVKRFFFTSEEAKIVEKQSNIKEREKEIKRIDKRIDVLEKKIIDSEKRVEKIYKPISDNRPSANVRDLFRRAKKHNPN